MAGVFSALCVTPKALSLTAKFAKTVSRLLAVASAFAKIRLFDKQINWELEGALEFAQLSSPDFGFLIKEEVAAQREGNNHPRTHGDLQV